MKFKRYYPENAAICGNCNGQGLQGHDDYCRVCQGTGVMSWREFKGDTHEADEIALGVVYTSYVRALTSFVYWK